MLAPTPMLRPSPLDISGIFAGTFEALKRRFGLFILLALFPGIVALVLIGVGLAIVIPSVVIAGSGDTRSLPTGILSGMVLIFLGSILTALAQLKAQGMMNLAAYEIAQGQHPDFRGLLTRTKGFLPRMAPLIALGIGVLIVAYALVLGIGLSMVGALDGSSGGRAAAVLGILMLVVLVLGVVGFVVATKLLYTIPSIAIEQLGGVAGLKRSWRLTRGAFWRTLGYYLVASIAVAAVSSVVSFVSQLALVPASMGFSNSSDRAQILAGIAAMIPVLFLVFVLQMAVQVVSLPFLQAYVTYMFIDQVRRSELPPGYGTAAYGAGQGQYYAQPGQYYGQPAPGYPQPGQPPQAAWPPVTPQPPNDRSDPPASS